MTPNKTAFKEKFDDVTEIEQEQWNQKWLGHPWCGTRCEICRSQDQDQWNETSNLWVNSNG